jgi:hypothetical protein
MMLSVFPSLRFVDRIPQAQCAAACGRSSCGFFLGFDPKATAYKALGTAIEGGYPLLRYPRKSPAKSSSNWPDGVGETVRPF